MWPDVDVIGIKREANPLLEFECVDVLRRQLQSSGSIQHRKLLGDHAMPAVLIDARAPQHFAARSAIPYRDGPSDVVGDLRVVCDDNDGDDNEASCIQQ